MLRDATGYGFIEEFDEYASRSTLSPDDTGTLPPPSPPSGRGDVLRIRSPESTRDTFRIVESFFLLAPPPLGGVRSPQLRGRSFVIHFRTTFIHWERERVRRSSRARSTARRFRFLRIGKPEPPCRRRYSLFHSILASFIFKGVPAPIRNVRLEGSRMDSWVPHFPVFVPVFIFLLSFETNRSIL